MSDMTLQFSFQNEDDEEVELSLPAKYEVCSDCEGHGKVLNEAMREHAYTAEEFYENFDDEECEEYFKRGGRYDVRCETCKGDRVEKVVDESQFKEEDKANYALYLKKLERQAEYAAERRAEERYGY